jgi:hypothetical protein
MFIKYGYNRIMNFEDGKKIFINRRKNGISNDFEAIYDNETFLKFSDISFPSFPTSVGYKNKQYFFKTKLENKLMLLHGKSEYVMEDSEKNNIIVTEPCNILGFYLFFPKEIFFWMGDKKYSFVLADWWGMKYQLRCSENVLCEYRSSIGRDSNVTVCLSKDFDINDEKSCLPMIFGLFIKFIQSTLRGLGGDD